MRVDGCVNFSMYVPFHKTNSHCCNGIQEFVNLYFGAPLNINTQKKVDVHVQAWLHGSVLLGGVQYHGIPGAHVSSSQKTFEHLSACVSFIS